MFWDFGDSSLVFQVYFSIEVHNKMQRWEFESLVRYSINDTLNDAGIVIAFPQTDVHLDTSKPINMRILKRGE
ncbi:MAG: hypothetical protein AB4426_05085 [Xenococcaceae cyanobacterium]